MRTCERFPYCWVHLKSIDGLVVKDSTVPDAGRGLFATRRFKRGKRVTKYSGRVVRKGTRGDYVLNINQTQSLDAGGLNNLPGRFINDPKGTRRRANVRFSRSSRINTDNATGKRYVPIIALRTIQPGHEVLVNCGRNYW